MRDEFLEPEMVSSDEEVDEVGLRPRKLSEFVGHDASDCHREDAAVHRAERQI